MARYKFYIVLYCIVVLVIFMQFIFVHNKDVMK